MSAKPLRSVWIVIVQDAESFYVTAVCKSKEVAKKYLFRERDRLIQEWQEMVKWCEQKEYKNNMYKDMIKNLSDDDYENWNNYPHECPAIYREEIKYA